MSLPLLLLLPLLVARSAARFHLPIFPRDSRTFLCSITEDSDFGQFQDGHYWLRIKYQEQVDDNVSREVVRIYALLVAPSITPGQNSVVPCKRGVDYDKEENEYAENLSIFLVLWVLAVLCLGYFCK
jgi:hypothetical protein